MVRATLHFVWSRLSNPSSALPALRGVKFLKFCPFKSETPTISNDQQNHRHAKLPSFLAFVPRMSATRLSSERQSPRKALDVTTSSPS